MITVAQNSSCITTVITLFWHCSPVPVLTDKSATTVMLKVNKNRYLYQRRHCRLSGDTSKTYLFATSYWRRWLLLNCLCFHLPNTSLFSFFVTCPRSFRTIRHVNLFVNNNNNNNNRKVHTAYRPETEHRSMKTMRQHSGTQLFATL